MALKVSILEKGPRVGFFNFHPLVNYLFNSLSHSLSQASISRLCLKGPSAVGRPTYIKSLLYDFILYWIPRENRDYIEQNSAESSTFFINFLSHNTKFKPAANQDTSGVSLQSNYAVIYTSTRSSCKITGEIAYTTKLYTQRASTARAESSTRAQRELDFDLLMLYSCCIYIHARITLGYPRKLH